MNPKIKWYEWPLPMIYAVWAMITYVFKSAWESIKGGNNEK